MRAESQQYFSGPIEPIHTPTLYTVSVALVAVAMVLLPLLYLALVLALGWGVWRYADGVLPTIADTTRSWRVHTLAFTPIVAGVVVVFFLLKPFLARRPSPHKPLSLRRDQAPGLFALVEALCDVLGAPVPRRVDVDVRVNAAASLRRGAWSLFSNDLVLTIGLPLVDGLSLRQFTGVLAHEFGHFSQGAGMRLGFVIRSINAWFARVVYARDSWDRRLEAWASADGASLPKLMANVAKGCVWVSRHVLLRLMQGGHATSMLLSRQMEFDADQAEARTVGSAAFAETSRRLHVLDLANQWAHSDLRGVWQRKRQLGDDLPALVQANLRQIRPEEVERLLATALQSTPSMYDSHPPTEQRIACATSPHWDGVLVPDGAARDLFADFPKMCRLASIRYYEEMLGDEFRREQLSSSAHIAAEGEEEASLSRARAEYFGNAFEGACWLALPPATPPLPPNDAHRALESARAERETMQTLRAKSDELFGRLIGLARVRGAAEAELKFDPSELGVASTERAVIDQTIVRARIDWELSCEALRAACPQLLRHLASVVDAAPSEVVSALRRLETVDQRLSQLVLDVNALRALVAQGPRQDHPALGRAIAAAIQRLRPLLHQVRDPLTDLLTPLNPDDELVDQAKATVDETARLYARQLGLLARHALSQAELASLQAQLVAPSES